MEVKLNSMKQIQDNKKIAQDIMRTIVLMESHPIADQETESELIYEISSLYNQLNMLYDTESKRTHDDVELKDYHIIEFEGEYIYKDKLTGFAPRLKQDIMKENSDKDLKILEETLKNIASKHYLEMLEARRLLNRALMYVENDKNYGSREESLSSEMQDFISKVDEFKKDCKETPQLDQLFQSFNKYYQTKLK